jgi:hypothetical protein
MTYRLGLHDPVPGAVKLRFGSYAIWKQLPTPPNTFGHTGVIKEWGMLGNGAASDNPPGLPDGAGCCAYSGPAHQIMQATAEAGNPARFTADAVLNNYSGGTGFTIIDPSTGQPWPPDENPTDQGAAIDDVAKQWRQHGMIDADGNTHQITAYLDLNPGDLRELWLASWMFPLGVTCGYALPESAIEQAQDGVIWDVVKGSPIAGGHCVPALARPAANMGVGISWGKPRPFTVRWHQTYNNQGIVVLSKEGFIKAKTLEGFDFPTLADDLKEITRL